MVESDEEQLEVLKKWWDENGTSLIVTVVLVLGGTFGYRAWENSVRETGEAASAMYEDLVVATSVIQPGTIDDSVSQSVISLGEKLKTEYPDTTYATFAAMHLAKLAVDEGDLDRARAELEWALEQGAEGYLETIVRTRLARVLIAQEDAGAALTVLEGHEAGPAQLSTLEEVRGDAYHALGEMQQAREAYQKAIEYQGEGISKPLLEVKLADIPVAASEVAIQDAVEVEQDSDGESDGDIEQTTEDQG